jgi:hypothetical protein
LDLLMYFFYVADAVEALGQHVRQEAPDAVS